MSLYGLGQLWRGPLPAIEPALLEGTALWLQIGARCSLDSLAPQHGPGSPPAAPGFCIALCLRGTVAQNHGIQGTTEDCNSHMLCPANATCVNNTHCTCLDGYETRENHPIFFTDPTEICDDINECLGPSPPDCGRNTHCANVAGSYSCTCIDGYEPSSGKANFTNASENTCQDIDECQRNTTICEPHGTCINMPGSYMCKCSERFGKSQKDPSQICTDIDECNKTRDICGPNATCINTNGSYRCKCWIGYIPFNGSTTLCQELTCPQLLDDDNSAEAKNLQGSFQAQMGRLCKAALEELKQMNSQNAEEKPQGFLDILEKEINLVEEQSESVEQRHRSATVLMATVEKLLRKLAMTLRDRMMRFAPTKSTELGLAVRQAGNQSQETVTLQQSKMQMELNWAGAPGQENEGFTLAGLLTCQRMSPILDGAGRVEMPKWDEIGQTGKQAQEPGRPSYRVLSPVASAFISDPNPQALGLSVSIRFSHPVPENKTDLRLLCAYWEPDSRRWATHGCTLQNLTTNSTRCQCNHLASFAVLMAFYELEDWTLDVITKVGLVISLLCLLLSIITFLFCRALKGPRTTIHLHLCLALFIAYTVFLIGISSTGNRVVCGVVAGLLHYFFLAAFCWMCLEGAELYLLVVQVFTPHGLRRRYMFLLGYGVPALIVGISATTYSEGYGTARQSIVATEGADLFAEPLLHNPDLGVQVAESPSTVQQEDEEPLQAVEDGEDVGDDQGALVELEQAEDPGGAQDAELGDGRDGEHPAGEGDLGGHMSNEMSSPHVVLTITAIAQLCVLGTTWIFGLFQFNQRSLVVSYIFTILNSLQGLFIFLLHCLLKKQVRDEYRRWLSCGGLKRPAKNSDFSSSTTSRTEEPMITVPID
nr:adhesion G protein-coupled receptor E5-like [Chrysemys picta bellii]